MDTSRTVKAVVAFLIGVSMQLAAPRTVSAQAWLPAKGEGNYSISYENLFLRDHFFADGSRHDFGHIRINGIVQDFEYGLTDKTAVNISVPPFIISKYKGAFPHVNSGNTDDGNYHGAFQDFRVGLRYNLRMRPLVVTPVVEAVVPSHPYEQFAHSLAGYDLREYRFGVNLGRRLDPILPKGFFQTRYTYAIVERHLGIRPNRSRIESQFGYILTRRVRLSALELLQITHSGLDFPQDFPSRKDERWRRHAQISRLNFLNLGVGAGLAVTKSFELFGSWTTDVWGQNGHALNRAVSFGVNWNFRTRWFVRQAFAGQADEICDVVCRKCQRVFPQPDSADPVLTSSMASGR